DPEVRDYVLGQPDATAFLDAYAGLLGVLSAGYRREGKHWLTIAVGCTGGKHRSVAMADALGRKLGETGFDVRVVHRDMGRE
ncbi:MAG: RNase adapter protein RapZ, partial [Frankiaceae bacterium]|nr:RNase adapter protein RapZ [Frankiaceae bacterium]